MQEDMVGPLDDLGHRYEACSVCGQLYPATLLRARDGEVALGVRSAQEDVCAECGRLLDQGEEPGFPLDGEE